MRSLRNNCEEKYIIKGVWCPKGQHCIFVLYIRFSIIKSPIFHLRPINEVRLTIKQFTCNWLLAGLMFIFMYKGCFNMLRLRFLSSNLLSLCILMHNMIMNSQHII